MVMQGADECLVTIPQAPMSPCMTRRPVHARSDSSLHGRATALPAGDVGCDVFRSVLVPFLAACTRAGLQTCPSPR